MTNRLANETSPYLLQHAHNPVDWYPWGDEAFAKSRAEDKPVFLSIGYSACHWCHVMERESFENEQIAALLNERFVSIKVDREERPDIDSIYMQAVQLMNGHGGWPMSVFLTPEGKPFYAGTYFPPQDSRGMPGFPRVIAHVSEAYRERRDEVESASSECTAAIQRSVAVPAGGSSLDHAALDRAAGKIAQAYDPVHGGFGSAPKFPPSMTAEFLMQVAHRTGDSRLRDMLTHTLTKMARGGMYDQIGGGFHRYSVDARWLVPHFEKMLYDNALLARLYTHAWQWTKEPLFARVAHEILDWVQLEMTAPDGGFYATLDADSEGEEGKFYVWSRAEVLQILGDEEGRPFCALYDLTDRGNFEGHNIPNIPREPESVAADFGLTMDALDATAAKGKAALYAVRARRVWPGRDEKILSGWNGWMLAAFAEASLAFDHDGYRETARRNADFLVSRIDSDGRLLRHAKIAGLLEDYSGAAWGLTLAYEALHARKYLDGAVALTTSIVQRFSDPEGGFFDAANDAEKLITRPKDLFDNATPGGASVTAEVLLRLALLTGNMAWVETAIKSIESAWPLAEKYPSGFGFLLGVAEWRAGSPKELAITGDIASEEFRRLQRVVGETFLPHRVLAAGADSHDLPLLQHRDMTKAMAYLCTGYACQEPVSDPERWRALLSAER